MRFSLARVDSVSKRTGRRTHRVLHGHDARRKRAKREIARERSRVFIIRLCHDRKKKLQRRAKIRLESLRQFNTRREEKEMRVRGLKNAERRKTHNDAADDDEKEEEEKKGEKESRKARREKIPP